MIVVRCPACDHGNIPGEDLCEHCGMDLAGLDVGTWGVAPEDPLLSRTLAEIELKRPLVVLADDPVSAAVEKMKRRHEGCVFVLDDRGAPLGVLGEREVVVGVAAPGRDPDRTPVREIMDRAPITLERSDPLAWALHRMGVDGRRHVAVTDEGALVGFLSIRTVLSVLRDTQGSAG